MFSPLLVHVWPRALHCLSGATLRMAQCTCLALQHLADMELASHSKKIASAEGLADLGAYLLAPDHGALDLLHALSWDSVLATLAPGVHAEARLNDRAQQWATQLTLLALQCMVLLPHAQLPAWLQSLSQPLGEHALLELVCDPASKAGSQPTLSPDSMPCAHAKIWNGTAGSCVITLSCLYLRCQHSAHGQGACRGWPIKAGPCHLSSRLQSPGGNSLR